jgi:hypothetical protein
MKSAARCHNARRLKRREETSMSDKEYDQYGVPIDPAERMQLVMLGFYNLFGEAGDADFPGDLVAELNQLRLKFMDEFERRFPGEGSGRAIWR